MLGKCFFIICALSVVCAAFTGNLTELAGAAVDGAGRGVTLSVSMLGMMCLWCGVMEVLRDCGAVGVLSRLLRPVLSRFFPDAFRRGIGGDEITASVAANMLGIANAATPFALAAMEKMDRENDDPSMATDDMVTLAVLGSSSISLIPTTIITLRRAAGSSAPFSVMVPVWITSFACTAAGMILCRLAAAGKRRKRGRLPESIETGNGIKPDRNSRRADDGGSKSDESANKAASRNQKESKTVRDVTGAGKKGSETIHEVVNMGRSKTKTANESVRIAEENSESLIAVEEKGVKAVSNGRKNGKATVAVSGRMAVRASGGQK